MKRNRAVLGAWVLAGTSVVAGGCTVLAGLDGEWRQVGGSGGEDAPSCAESTVTCGPNGESCCATRLVPSGTFKRSNLEGFPATVSDFRLDRFEITVGRFRAFVAAYPGSKPAAGAGAHPNALIGDSGWKSSEWDAYLPSDQMALKTTANCDSGYQTWTDSVSGNEQLPMNCLSWYVAFAFCAWDGGRLPTEAEWNYAAAAGGEQRVYPWSNPPESTSITDSQAVYATSAVLGVGSKSPAGDARWGQADMAGNVWEWTLDCYADPYPPGPSNDCANLTDASARVLRGGSFNGVASGLLSSFRVSFDPSARSDGVGARCARTP